LQACRSNAGSGTTTKTKARRSTWPATGSAVVGLSDATLDKLRELRRLNVDSAKGYEEIAELIKKPEIQAAFTAIAVERAEQAAALATQITWNEGAEPESGSYLAALHRAWIKVRDACTTDSLATVLSEAERGEDAIKQAYEEALTETAGSPIHDVIKTQYAAVKKTHDAVRDFRDAHNQ